MQQLARCRELSLFESGILRHFADRWLTGHFLDFGNTSRVAARGGKQAIKLLSKKSYNVWRVAILLPKRVHWIGQTRLLSRHGSACFHGQSEQFHIGQFCKALTGITVLLDRDSLTIEESL